MTVNEVKNIANKTIEHLIYNLIDERESKINMYYPYSYYGVEKPQECNTDNYDCNKCTENFFFFFKI